MRCKKLLAVCGLWAILGCGEGYRVDVSVTPPPPPAAKALLEEVAATGELGSGALAIRESLEQLRATDPAKAEVLIRELDQLATLGDPRYVRYKASQMAAQL